MRNNLAEVPPQKINQNDRIESDTELAKIAQKYTDREETGPYLRQTATDEEDMLNNRNVAVRGTYERMPLLGMRS